MSLCSAWESLVKAVKHNICTHIILQAFVVSDVINCRVMLIELSIERYHFFQFEVDEAELSIKGIQPELEIASKFHSICSGQNERIFCPFTYETCQNVL